MKPNYVVRLSVLFGFFVFAFYLSGAVGLLMNSYIGQSKSGLILQVSNLIHGFQWFFGVDLIAVFLFALVGMWIGRWAAKRDVVEGFKYAAILTGIILVGYFVLWGTWAVIM